MIETSARGNEFIEITEKNLREVRAFVKEHGSFGDRVVTTPRAMGTIGALVHQCAQETSSFMVRRLPHLWG